MTTTPQVRFQTVGGVRIRYADSDGSREPVILLTSPWPESVYAFAPIWDTLAEHARLVAIDLPGFGASGCSRSRWAAVSRTRSTPRQRSGREQRHATRANDSTHQPVSFRPEYPVLTATEQHSHPRRNSARRGMAQHAIRGRGSRPSPLRRAPARPSPRYRSPAAS